MCFLFLIGIVLNAVVVYTRLSTDLQRVCVFIVLLLLLLLFLFCCCFNCWWNYVWFSRKKSNNQHHRKNVTACLALKSAPTPRSSLPTPPSAPLLENEQPQQPRYPGCTMRCGATLPRVEDTSVAAKPVFIYWRLQQLIAPDCRTSAEGAVSSLLITLLPVWLIGVEGLKAFLLAVLFSSLLPVALSVNFYFLGGKNFAEEILGCDS